MPVTQWLNDRVPVIDPQEWRLEVVSDGTRRWTLEKLQDFDDELTATLDCTGGWYAEQTWAGVRLDRLLGGSSRSIEVVSSTGYARSFPRSDATRLLLALRMGDRPLDPGHGGPVRVVAPGRRGFWWVKWVVRVQATDRPWWLQSPFPLT